MAPFGNDATLAECCELIDEMKTIYSCAEDVEQVSLTMRTYEELMEACNEKELLAKDAVRGEELTVVGYKCCTRKGSLLPHVRGFLLSSPSSYRKHYLLFTLRPVRWLCCLQLCWERFSQFIPPAPGN